MGAEKVGINFSHIVLASDSISTMEPICGLTTQGSKVEIILTSPLPELGNLYKPLDRYTYLPDIIAGSTIELSGTTFPLFPAVAKVRFEQSQVVNEIGLLAEHYTELYDSLGNRIDVSSIAENSEVLTMHSNGILSSIKSEAIKNGFVPAIYGFYYLSGTLMFYTFENIDRLIGKHTPEQLIKLQISIKEEKDKPDQGYSFPSTSPPSVFKANLTADWERITDPFPSFVLEDAYQIGDRHSELPQHFSMADLNKYIENHHALKGIQKALYNKLEINSPADLEKISVEDWERLSINTAKKNAFIFLNSLSISLISLTVRNVDKPINVIYSDCLGLIESQILERHTKKGDGNLGLIWGTAMETAIEHFKRMAEASPKDSKYFETFMDIIKSYAVLDADVSIYDRVTT